MAAADGDGWVECALGHRHWGRHGAAGILIYRSRTDGDRGVEVLLQHRAEWSHHGGTWGVLGGARHSSELPKDAALREAGEEATLSAGVTVDGQHDDDHGTWTYSTIVAQADADLAAAPAGGETLDVDWWPVEQVGALALHPGFAVTWPLLRRSLHPWHVVVDVANVLGSSPDGWWRDRVGATRRFVRTCAALATAGLAQDELADVRPGEVLHRRWPRWTLVLEGPARAAATTPCAGVRLVAAPRSGDDAIVAAAAASPGPTLVVTADRELRRRTAEAGASAVGARWLLDRLHSGAGSATGAES